MSEPTTQERKTMPEQHPNFKPCPFCGGTAKTGQPLVFEREGDFSIICSECGFERGDFNDIEHAERCWNIRYFSSEDIEMILASEGQQSQDFDPALLKRAILFYWLAAALLSSFSFFNESTFREGLAGFLIIAGLFTLIYAGFNFIRSLSNQEEGQA